VSKFEKFKQKIMQGELPKDITPTELQTFLTKLGFVLRNRSGSHFVYNHPKHKEHISIPMHNPIKRPYIKELRDIIEAIEKEAE